MKNFDHHEKNIKTKEQQIRDTKIWVGHWFQENWFKLAIIICILIGITVFFQYNKQRDSEKANQELLKITNEELKKQENSTALQRCLLAANIQYSLNWNAECKINSMNDKIEDCTLPTWDAEIVENKRVKDKDYCFKQYPQN